MKRLYHNGMGFSAPELLIVVLVIGALFGVGGYVWSKNGTKSQSTSKTSTILPGENGDQSQSTNPDPYANWRTYANNDLGIKFRYPEKWGTPSVERKALNDAKYETNLPYLVKFSGAETPFARIFPSDWKFTPPTQTEWRSPLLREDLEAYQVKVVNDQTKIVAISYSSFSGEVSLAGIRSLVLPRLNATQIELHKDDPYDAKRPCLKEQKNKYGSMEIMATLDCYPEAYRDTAVRFLDSFTAM